jgi:hypothetical protein
MAHSSTILSQMLKLIPRHEFHSLSEQHDNKRRAGALSRWSQFVAMFTCQVPVRRIVFRDEALNKEFVFTTNRFDWPATLVAQIYKQR